MSQDDENQYPMKDLSKSKKSSSSSEFSYHTLTVEEVSNLLNTDIEQGLTQDNASQRLLDDGKNELKGKDGVSPFTILLRNLVNGMSIILTTAMVVCFATKQWVEAAAILFVIFFNTIIGFLQEYKSEQALASLKKMTAPSALVIRDGKRVEINTKDVVKGDIVCIEMGDIVCADLRVVKSNNLSIDEALLTGESMPVDKMTSKLLEEDEAIGDRINLCYMSTIVTKGKGTGIVIRTGMETEIGKIANKLKESTRIKTSPLKRTLDIIAYSLFAIAVVLAVIVMAVNDWETEDKSYLLYAISVGICIIPEGLPAVLTITMTTGVKTMTRQKAIVRRLMALETIGAATNICSDKTGTLTSAKMFASTIWLPDAQLYTVTGHEFGLKGEIIDKESEEKVEEYPYNLDKLLHCTSLCNVATFEEEDDENSKDLSPDDVHISVDKDDDVHSSVDEDDDFPSGVKPVGDPTEISLMILSKKLNRDKDFLMDKKKYKFIHEHQFDSSIKRMTVIYERKKEYIGFLKGAPERVLECCSHYLLGDKLKPIEEKFLKRVQEVNDNLASQGLRVLALSYRPDMNKKDIDHREKSERKFVFIGFVGIYDPPRPESKGAVMVCHRAGITVHVATGDHPATAKAIAKEVGILPDDYSDHLVMVAKDFDKLSDEEVDDLKELPLVVARCSPESKVKLINALFRRKKTVVMTGDGVNDAPALSSADIGVAMGKNGSDVAKDSSDIVITDDNFATIVLAVSQGRRILHNITQAIIHLMSGNIGQIVTLMVGLFITDDNNRSIFPLSPLQALWVNLIVSSPPAIGLGQQRQSKDAMRRSPKPAGKRLGSSEFIVDILFYGIIQGCLALSAFIFSIYIIHDGNLGHNCNKSNSESIDCDGIFKSRAVTFTVLCILPFYHAFNCKDPRKPIWRTNVLENKILVIAILASLSCTIPLIYIPFINDKVFVMIGIGGYEWLVIFASLLIFIVISEVYKLGKGACIPYKVSDMTEPLEDLELKAINAK